MYVWLEISFSLTWSIKERRDVRFCQRAVGGYSGEEPPLPIPNREVKLPSADGTAFRWESRSPPTKKYVQDAPGGFTPGASSFMKNETGSTVCSGLLRKFI